MMRHNSQSTVHLFVGKMASADDLEAYVTVFYDEEGEYVPSAFETAFGIDLDPDFLEAEWFDQASSDLPHLLTGFSYDDQLMPQFPEDLADPVNSLILIYEADQAPFSETDGVFLYLGKASYYP